MTQTAPKTVLRFRRSERLVHWFIVVPFIICYSSALILFLVYNPDPSRPYRAIFSWIHRLSGACLVVLPPIAIISHLHEIGVHLRNLREGWVWSVHEFKWLFMFALSIFKKNVKLPEENKFNAAEKINFMMVMVAYIVFGSTGIVIWAFDGVLLPWILHFTMAALMTPLMLGHIYMATLNPASRTGLSGMINGYVDAHWAHHHYPRWFRREHGHAAAAESEHEADAALAPTDTSAPAAPESASPPKPPLAPSQAPAHTPPTASSAASAPTDPRKKNLQK